MISLGLSKSPKQRKKTELMYSFSLYFLVRNLPYTNRLYQQGKKHGIISAAMCRNMISIPGIKSFVTEFCSRPLTPSIYIPSCHVPIVPYKASTSSL
jgi:hypothetical protein